MEDATLIDFLGQMWWRVESLWFAGAVTVHEIVAFVYPPYRRIIKGRMPVQWRLFAVLVLALIGTLWAGYGMWGEQQSVLKSVQGKLAAKSVSSLTIKIERLEQELNASRSWSISERHLNNLASILRETKEISPLYILPMANHYPADSLGHKVLGVFLQSGWGKVDWTLINYVPPNTKGIYIAVPLGTDLKSPPPEAQLLEAIFQEAGFLMRKISVDTSLNRLCRGRLCFGIVIGERN